MPSLKRSAMGPKEDTKAQPWNKKTMVNTLNPNAVSILRQFTFGMPHFLLQE